MKPITLKGDRLDMTRDGLKFRTHELKTFPWFFEAMLNGSKTFEVRKDDRCFCIGDILHLREHDSLHDVYTGRELKAMVRSKFKGIPGLDDEYCIMGITLFDAIQQRK